LREIDKVVAIGFEPTTKKKVNRIVDTFLRVKTKNKV